MVGFGGFSGGHFSLRSPYGFFVVVTVPFLGESFGGQRFFPE